MKRNSLTDLAPTRRKVLKQSALATGVVFGVSASAQPTAAHEWCPRTPGFWKNPKNWSKAPHLPSCDDDGNIVVVCNFGGTPVETKNEAIDILKTPPKYGDKLIIMSHHVLATKLNLNASGWTETRRACIRDALSMANSWLKDAGWEDGYTAQKGTTWTDGGFDGEPYKDKLDDFNNNRFDCGCV